MTPMKPAATDPSALRTPEYQSQVPSASVPAPYQASAVQAVMVDNPTDVAQVQDPGNTVDILSPDRQARMGTGLDTAQDILVTVIQVDAVNLVARHHDVVHRHFFQRQEIEHHVSPPGGDQCASLCDQGTQLFL